MAFTSAPLPPTPTSGRTESLLAWREAVMACSDLAELEEHAAILLAEIQDIEAQLAAPQHIGPDGQPLTGAAYQGWRARAVASRHAKTNLYRPLKSRIRDLRVQAHSRATWERANLPEEPTAELLLRRALGLLQDLARTGRVVYEPDEQALVYAIRNHVQAEATALRQGDTAHGRSLQEN
jgi:hypothetical protein